MVDVSRKFLGKGGGMKDLNLVVLAYDKSVNARKDKDGAVMMNDAGEPDIKSHYLDVRMHPGDERATGQPTLALATTKNKEPGADGKPTYNNSRPYAASQMAKIKEAAGDNHSPLLNKAGESVGTIYGIEADAITVDGNLSIDTNKHLLIDTTKLHGKGLSVEPVAGDDGKPVTIQDQIFTKQVENKAIRTAAAAAAKAAALEAAAPAAETTAPAVEEPSLG